MYWTFSSDRAIYLQIIDQIKLSIASGSLAAGERLPSVRDIAAKAGVNPNTMQRAFSELEREGLVFTNNTTGRFITTDEKLIKQTKDDLAHQIVCDFLDKMRNLGLGSDDAAKLINYYKNGGNKDE